MENNLISVIIPVYNVKQYIERCIDSVLNQTYKNIEIILVDDGSNDGCNEICNMYAEKDKRIKVVHIKNSGVSNARNLGIRLANGDFITFVDADDYIDTSCIEKMYKLCKDEQCDIGIVGTLENNELTNKTNTSGESIDMVLSAENALKEMLNEKYYYGNVWGKIYKTDIWKNVHFNEDTVIGEDMEVLYKVLLKSNKVKINTNERLYYYTKNRNDSATKSNYNKNWEKEIAICENILKDCRENHKDVFPFALKRYIRINYSCIVKILTYDSENKEVYTQLRKNILKYNEYGIYNKFDLKMKVKIRLVLYFKKLAIILLRK